MRQKADPLSDEGAALVDVRLCCAFGPHIVDLACSLPAFRAWQEGTARLLVLVAKAHDPQRFAKGCGAFAHAWQADWQGAYRTPVPSLRLAPDDFKGVTPADDHDGTARTGAKVTRPIAYGNHLLEGYVWEEGQGRWGEAWRAVPIGQDGDETRFSLLRDAPGAPRQWTRAIDLMNAGLEALLLRLDAEPEAIARPAGGPREAPVR